VKDVDFIEDFDQVGVAGDGALRPQDENPELYGMAYVPTLTHTVLGYLLYPCKPVCAQPSV
jgi:hypothetical protein